MPADTRAGFRVELAAISTASSTNSSSSAACLVAHGKQSVVGPRPAAAQTRRRAVRSTARYRRKVSTPRSTDQVQHSSRLSQPWADGGRWPTCRQHPVVGRHACGVSRWGRTSPCEVAGVEPLRPQWVMMGSTATRGYADHGVTPDLALDRAVRRRRPPCRCARAETSGELDRPRPSGTCDGAAEGRSSGENSAPAPPANRVRIGTNDARARWVSHATERSVGGGRGSRGPP